MQPVNTSSLLALVALCLALYSPALGGLILNKGIGRELLENLKTLNTTAACNGTFFSPTDVENQSHICFIQELDLVKRRCKNSTGTEDNFLGLVYITRRNAEAFLPGGRNDPSRNSVQRCEALRRGSFDDYLQAFTRCVQKCMGSTAQTRSC